MRSQPLHPIPLLAILLSVAALLIALIKSPGSDLEPRSVADTSSVAAEQAVLEARLSDLARENEALKERLRRLELRPTEIHRAPSQGTQVTAADLASLEAALLARIESRNAQPTSATPEVLKEQVVRTLGEIRKAEAIGSAQRQLEAQANNVDKTVKTFGSWMQLSPQQDSAFRTAVLNRFEQERRLLVLWEAGTPADVLAQQKAADQERFTQEVNGFLSPEQQMMFQRVAPKLELSLGVAIRAK